MITVATMATFTHGQSLYDLAMPIGLEESLPLKWNANVSFGYDDNVNATSSSLFGRQESAYSSFGIGATMSNYDSRTQYSFDMNLGLITYFSKLSDGTEQVMSNSNVNGRLTHHFDSTMSYSASVSLAWQPEPDYENGISASRRMGDYLYVYLNNSLSKAWDSRWSTTVGFNGTVLAYQENVGKSDNRDYLSLYVNNRYKWTERLAVSMNVSGTYCDRKYGLDDKSLFLMGGVEYALTANTSATILVGPQFKFIDSTTRCYPSVEGAINHQVSDRLALRAFVRFANEDNSTYYGEGRNFRSNESWRVGASSTWQFTPRFSVSLDSNFISSRYDQSTASNLSNYTASTFNVNTGFYFKVTEALTAQATYSFTRGQYLDNNVETYNRNVFSVGAVYSF